MIEASWGDESGCFAPHLSYYPKNSSGSVTLALPWPSRSGLAQWQEGLYRVSAQSRRPCGAFDQVASQVSCELASTRGSPLASANTFQPFPCTLFPSTLHSIGCNKGYHTAEMFDLFAPELGINKASLRSALDGMYKAGAPQARRAQCLSGPPTRLDWAWQPSASMC